MSFAYLQYKYPTSSVLGPVSL